MKPRLRAFCGTWSLMPDEALAGTELYAWLSRHYFTYDYLCRVLADDQVSDL